MDAGSTSSFLVYYGLVFVVTNVTSGGIAGANITNGVGFPTASTSKTIGQGVAVRISNLFSTSTVNSGTKTILFTLKRSGSIVSSNTATLTVSPNVLTGATLNVPTTTVSTATTYNFSITTTNPLGTGAAVKITLPTEITIATGACTATVTLSIVNALSSVISCNAADSQTILVSNITNTLISGGTLITILVDNVNNPTTTRTTSSLFYQTYYSLSQLTDPVDDSTGFTLTVTPAAITIPSANFVAARTDSTNRLNAAYTFTYNVYTTFPPNGHIVLILPSAMSLASGATANYVISTTGANNTVSMTSNSSLTQTEVTLNFNGLIGTTLANGTIFTITIADIVNYYSFKPINIQMIAYTADGFAVEQSDAAAVTLINTVTDSNLVVGTNNANTVNGDTIAYSFTVTSPVALTATDVITFELTTTGNANTQLAYTSSVTCTIGGVAATCSKDIANSNILSVTTGAAIAGGSTVTVAVTSVVLTRSQDTPGNVTIRTY